MSTVRDDDDDKVSNNSSTEQPLPRKYQPALIAGRVLAVVVQRGFLDVPDLEKLEEIDSKEIRALVVDDDTWRALCVTQFPITRKLLAAHPLGGQRGGPRQYYWRWARQTIPLPPPSCTMDDIILFVYLEPLQGRMAIQGCKLRELLQTGSLRLWFHAGEVFEGRLDESKMRMRIIAHRCTDKASFHIFAETFGIGYARRNKDRSSFNKTELGNEIHRRLGRKKMHLAAELRYGGPHTILSLQTTTTSSTSIDGGRRKNYIPYRERKMGDIERVTQNYSGVTFLHVLSELRDDGLGIDAIVKENETAFLW